MNITKNDNIKSIRDIGLCLQTMIRNRFNKKTKVIQTDGSKYPSLYISFYKNHTWQFYIQDKVSYYIVFLLKNDKVVRKEIVRHNEYISTFHGKMMYFFRLI